MQRAAYDLVGIASDARRSAPVAAACELADDRVSAAHAISIAPRELAARPDDAIRSCRSKAKACTRFRSGPVHAGIIEPGHFRFSVVGEKVLRLEERLGYKHKGIEKRFESMTLADGRAARRARLGRLHGRLRVGVREAVGGDRGRRRRRRAPLWLRALLLERERIANTWATWATSATTAGFAFGLAQFSRLKEDVLRTNARSSATAI